MISWATILYTTGWMLSFFGAAMVVPLMMSYVTGGMAASAFLWSAIISVFIGGLLVFMNGTQRLVLRHKDAFLLTFLCWTILSVAGAMPLVMSGTVPTFVDGLFEAVSGLTTTGATVLSGLDTMDRGILLWRAMLQWLGGMGVIVLATAILPFLGVGGMQLYKAEMPGVVKDKLQPRLRETAKFLWLVYVLLTGSCALAYFVAGMTPFDAICHAFTTVATGGYSTRDASFGYFNSPVIEGIAITFMILGALNFSLHFMALRDKSLSSYFRDSETKVFLAILLVAVLVMVIKLVSGGYYSETAAVRHALFNTVAVFTTTGYSSVDYAVWPVTIPIMIMFLMFVGGCSGSTAGGMKVMRAIFIAKQGGRELTKLVHPRGIIPLKNAGKVVPEAVIQAVWSFVGLYVFCFAAITWVLSLYEMDLVTAFSAAGATLTGLGPALGELGPASNYSALAPSAKLILCFSMLLGRLELFTLLILFTPAFWRR